MMRANPEAVKQRINERLGEVLHQTSDGTFRPYVCICCDKVLKPNEVSVVSPDILKTNWSTLKADNFFDLSQG